MSMKGWVEAQNYKGGIIRYLYEKVKALDAAEGGDVSDISEIKAAIGKASGEGAGGILKDIADLEAALVRIENKTYGICRKTGKLISKERLRAVPHATLSIDAKLGKTS